MKSLIAFAFLFPSMVFAAADFQIGTFDCRDRHSNPGREFSITITEVTVGPNILPFFEVESKMPTQKFSSLGGVYKSDVVTRIQTGDANQIFRLMFEKDGAISGVAFNSFGPCLKR